MLSNLNTMVGWSIVLMIFLTQLFLLPVAMFWSSCAWWVDGRRILASVGVIFAVLFPIGLIIEFFSIPGMWGR